MGVLNQLKAHKGLTRSLDSNPKAMLTVKKIGQPEAIIMNDVSFFRKWSVVNKCILYNSMDSVS